MVDEQNANMPWSPVHESAAAPPSPTAGDATPPTVTPSGSPPITPAAPSEELSPVPVAADTGELVTPIQVPDAEELLPTGAIPVVPGANMQLGPPATDAGADAADTPGYPVANAINPISQLGVAAATNAALNAAGAPTPLAGIPKVGQGPTELPLPDFEAGTAFVPRFETPPPAPAENLARPFPAAALADSPWVSSAVADSAYQPARFSPATPVSGTPTEHVAPPSAHATPGTAAGPYSPAKAAPTGAIPSPLGALRKAGIGSPTDQELPPFTPISGTRPTTPPGAGDFPVPSPNPVATPTPPTDLRTAPGAGKPPPGRSARRRQRFPWWYVLLLLLVGAGLVLAWYQLWGKPEPIIHPTPTATVAAPQPTAVPVTVPTDSTLLESMPLTVGNYVLTAAAVDEDPLPPDLPARIPERATVSYGLKQPENTFQIRAWQHYSAADAAQNWAAYTHDAEPRAVTVGTEVVGSMAMITTAAGSEVVWHNGSVLFILSGPADQLEWCYDLFRY